MPSVSLGNLSAIGVVSFRSFPSRRFEVPLRGTPVIAGKGHMRLVPLERKRCHFLLAIFLAPAPSLFFFHSSRSIHSPSRPRSLDTATSLSIFCERIPDFLIAINGSIAAPFVALAYSNVSAPRFSYLKFRSYPHALIPA